MTEGGVRDNGDDRGRGSGRRGDGVNAGDGRGMEKGRHKAYPYSGMLAAFDGPFDFPQGRLRANGEAQEGRGWRCVTVRRGRKIFRPYVVGPLGLGAD